MIYIDKTAEKNKWPTFHDRLWKHCCKAMGECGGQYYEKDDGSLGRERTDKTEPQDTREWAKYRRQQFKGFSDWNFSFFCLEEDNFAVAKDKISLIEDITMYAYSYYSTPKIARCNGAAPQSTVNFPWLKSR